MISQLRNIDEELASRVATGLALPLPGKAPAAREPVDLPLSPALSLLGRAKHTLVGRKVGILFSDGSKKATIDTLAEAIRKEGGTPMLIAPRVGGIKVEGGTLKADGQLAGTPSVLVDAIALVLTEDAAEKLCSDSAAVGFVADAFAHLKAIGFTAGAQALLNRAGVQADEGVTDDLGKAFLSAASRRFFDREPCVRNLC